MYSFRIYRIGLPYVQRELFLYVRPSFYWNALCLYEHLLGISYILNYVLEKLR